MKQYAFPDNRLWKGLFGLFLFAMLILARDTLYTTSIIGFYKSQFLMLGLMVLAGLAFLIVNRRRLKEILTDRRMGLMLLCALVILAPMAVKRDFQLMYFSILLCLLFGLFLSYFVSLQTVSRYYVVILTVLAACSVIATYGLRLLPERGILEIPVFRNSIDVEFYNFGLALPSVSYVKNRNFGIFREPGVYQYFLILGLLLNNYMADWRKNSQLWTVNIILGITMLTTFATGGIAELGLLALILFIDKKWYRDRTIRTAAILAVLAVLGAVAWILIRKGPLYEDLTYMVLKIFSAEESSSTRLDAVMTDLGIFLHHPLFGEKLGQVLHIVDHNTTSTMLMLAIFGLPGGLLHLAGWLALVWSRDRKLWVNLGLLLVMLMSFNTQNLIADVFFWLMPTMALAGKIVALPGKGEKHGT